MKFSGHERQKVFDKPVIHPTPMHENILYQKSFEIQMCSPTNFIGVVKKNSSEKTDILFLCINSSIPEMFWNTEKIHSECCRYYEKKVDKNMMNIPATAILCIKIFDTWIFLNQRTALICILRHYEAEFFWQKIV